MQDKEGLTTGRVLHGCQPAVDLGVVIYFFLR